MDFLKIVSTIVVPMISPFAFAVNQSPSFPVSSMSQSSMMTASVFPLVPQSASMTDIEPMDSLDISSPEVVSLEAPVQYSSSGARIFIDAIAEIRAFSAVRDGTVLDQVRASVFNTFFVER
jgi:hypothetical protein